MFYQMKKLLVVALFFVLGLGFAPTVSEAATKKDCSYTGVQCKGVEIFRGDKLPFATNPIFVSAGTVITYGANNSYSDGQFQVTIQLWNTSLTQLVASQIVPYGKNSQFLHPATESGNYIVIIRSGDESQGRSHAYAWLRSQLY